MFNRMQSQTNIRFNSLNSLFRVHTGRIRSMLQSQFTSIGVQAMAGLNIGLNSGRGRVMATARNIANSVASTMKSALRIKSPSRLMRDDVGKEVPAGLAVGIRDNANLVYAELMKLAKGMMMVSSPEAALGTSNMAYTAGENH